MKPLVVAWLVAHGLPGWLAPDYATMVGVAGALSAVALFALVRRDGADEAVEARAGLLGYVAALFGGYLFEWIRVLPTAIAQGSLAPIAECGRAAYGGLLFGVLAPTLYLSVHERSIAGGLRASRAFLDRMTPGIGLTYFFVRIGCFLEGCDYGRPTSGWWGVRFPRGSLAAIDHATRGFVPAGAPSLPVHPTELYESMVGLVASACAWQILRKGRRDGAAFSMWIAVYAVGRFVIELVRGDFDRGIYGFFSTAQVVSLVLVVTVVAAHVRGRGLRRVAVAATLVVASVAFPEASRAEPSAPPRTPPTYPRGTILLYPPGTYTPGTTSPGTVVPYAPGAYPAGTILVYPPGSEPLPKGTFLVATTSGQGEPDEGVVHTRPKKESVGDLQRPAFFAPRASAFVGVPLGRPDVRVGGGAEIDGLLRLRAGSMVRFDLGPELRLFGNTTARHYSLGLDVGLVLELGRLEISFFLVPHHTWFSFSSPYFPAANAYGIRYGASLDILLGKHATLGVTPFAASTTSAESIGVISFWEPRVAITVPF